MNAQVPESLLRGQALEHRWLMLVGQQLDTLRLQVLTGIADLEASSPGEATEAKQVLREVRRLLHAAAITIEPARNAAFRKTFSDVP